MQFPIKYSEPVYRPPSEANSLLIQVTEGCSHNKCTYCAMYRKKSFRVRELEQILDEIDRVAYYFESKKVSSPEKIFLCDGDALAAPTHLLIQILDHLQSRFSKVRRISLYATAMNMLEKSPEELEALSERKLNLAYLGLESGSDRVLKKIVKGANAAEMIEGCLKLKDCGWKISAIGMLGVGGRELSDEHIEETARVLSEISPNFLSFLSTVAIPDTPMARLIDKKLMTELSIKELLWELYQIISRQKMQTSSILRVNHVSNSFQIGGVLPKDGEKLTEQLKSWWIQAPENIYPKVDPSFL